ncbi:DNA ligase-like domain-containing protein [Streptomyces massasporeus]|uniref:hypothetical protein n=1 Tax=Streptomyces massasporeus TaxID=67324 RepID=UPI0036CA0FB2
MTAAFPEIRAAALAQLPADTGRTASWWCGSGTGRCSSDFSGASPGAVLVPGEAARLWPAHWVVFDLLHADGDLTGWPYERRRAALEALFADLGVAAPMTLCPSTTDPTVVRGWPAGTGGRAGIGVRLEEARRRLRPLDDDSQN